ncbi:hypothetical protein B4125_1639 [Bacillus paralicheniformis]|uniref:Uncharacterized protein n=1 Tax=Bacillus paralicheniformis TaxID=1648923 RepID=A0ABY3FYZ1_9BACI|nr:hypothetical protein SC10_B2orf03133 [Bacillus paralicheniformis]OLG07458.1 hypothetical protein B4125_1639 [Bacillus paralicheniformis]TWJ56008.1 hypothetical protein CHCC5022_1136 [Bacillus paralicheniformis]TWJ62204.1 hypothetical protein CHCC5021_1671 [Bacillus paralicheniformis]TWK45081.1 hypothetical protein CHCC20348_0103 [Bacillus paralicheniformis]
MYKSGTRVNKIGIKKTKILVYSRVFVFFMREYVCELL